MSDEGPFGDIDQVYVEKGKVYVQERGGIGEISIKSLKFFLDTRGGKFQIHKDVYSLLEED